MVYSSKWYVVVILLSLGYRDMSDYFLNDQSVNHDLNNSDFFLYFTRV